MDDLDRGQQAARNNMKASYDESKQLLASQYKDIKQRQDCVFNRELARIVGLHTALTEKKDYLKNATLWSWQTTLVTFQQETKGRESLKLGLCFDESVDEDDAGLDMKMLEAEGRFERMTFRN